MVNIQPICGEFGHGLWLFHQHSIQFSCEVTNLSSAKNGTQNPRHPRPAASGVGAAGAAGAAAGVDLSCFSTGQPMLWQFYPLVI